MRVLKIAVFGFAVLGLAGSAQAYEHYIPLGTGYSTGVSSIAPLGSDEQALTSQTDIYESELYRKQLELRQNQSYINKFFSNSDSSSPDFSVDY